MRLLIICFAGILYSANLFAQVNLNTGLVSYFPFNGNSLDQGANGLNGTVNGATLTTDRNNLPNSAYLFNGTSNYIQLPYSNLYNFPINGKFTISVWIQPTLNNTWPAQALVVKSPFNSNYQASMWNYGTYMFNYKAMGGFANNNILNGTTTFTLNQCWYNIIQTYDNGKWNIYVNGVLESSDLSQTKFILQDGASSKIAFGRKGDASGDYYQGKMDDIRIYDRVINADEIANLSQQNGACLTNCNNWLKTPTFASTVNIGNLNVTGNQITVEGNFMCTSYSTPNFGGDLIAKHTNPGDVCYALSPHAAEISTSNNGYVYTLQTCTFELNKTYHVAMVYDGASLKFYRNGFLMSQTPCSGNISQNSLNAIIGNGPALPVVNQFIGNINEIRVWNVARTQSQLQTYMNTSLPNPTTQVGLLAYYTFDNLLNKQGNAAFNGTLNGGASINATNPNCSFVADSCSVIVNNNPIIINDYTPVLNLDPCKNILTVGNAAAYNVGDTVLMIQMKGAVIDSTNTAAFGTITDYKSAGNYEYNYVKSKTGNQIELKNKLLRTYEIPNGKVQLIRVPYYQNYSTTGKLTCLPWDGTVGGILVFNVANTLTLNNDIDVSGKGFRGAIPSFNNQNPCHQSSFYYPSTVQGGEKGEGLTDVSSSKHFGKGALANGGGGGNSDNSGGAGGSNSGQGGNGGKQWEGCSPNAQNNGGVGGVPLTNSSTINKLFLGGGGGMGHANDQLGFPAGNGGGIIMIQSPTIISNGKKIISNGINATLCTLGSNCTDGASGGGAGGSILLNASNYTLPTIVEAKGGNGADNFYNDPVFYPGANLGTGGGGGGGFVGISQLINNTNLQIFINGGINGVNTAHANNPHGATSGANGTNINSIPFFEDIIPFKPNIDSVKINATNTSCSNFNFNGLGYTNTSPIATWQWHFGDASTATGQNTSHNYATANNFTVKLVVTDINGCKDSVTKNITTTNVQVEAGNNQIFCGPQTNVQLNGSTTHNSTFNIYSWTSNPPTTISNSNSLTATTNINTTTTFYLSINDPSIICSGIDSVKVIINPIPVVQTLNDIAICKGTSLQLTSTLGLNTYHWSPGIYVSDSLIANPIFNDTMPRMLVLTGSNGLCTAKDTLNISIKPLPIVRTIKDTLICSTQSINLTTTGAATYSWTPATYLSSTISASPTYLATGATTFTSTTYYVTGTAANGCIAKDTVIVNMKIPNSFVTPPNKSFCKNESVQLDGSNGNNVTYIWQPNLNLSNPNIINPIANPATTANYTVNITDPVCNYSQVFPVIVTVNPLPNISITKSNDISCSLSSSNLVASGAQLFSWNSSPTLSSTSTPNTIASPTTTIQYFVTGTDLQGCKDTSSITVLVSSNINLFELPNTFTPNGDLKNDCFGIKNFGNAQEVFFIIYNRWGEKVFETNNINTCWKGYYKGIPAVEGNYVYYISAKTACGNIVKKGNVLLLR